MIIIRCFDNNQISARIYRFNPAPAVLLFRLPLVCSLQALFQICCLLQPAAAGNRRRQLSLG